MTQHNFNPDNLAEWPRGWARTYTGLALDLNDPQPDMISLEDIAIGLAHTARWRGQTYNPYSVARHSIQVVELTTWQFKMEALFHDATEAYIGDIPSPAKALLPDYKKLEQRLHAAIAEHFDISPEIPDAVKKADKLVLEHEWNQLIVLKTNIRYEPSWDKFKFMDLYEKLKYHLQMRKFA